MTAMAPLQVVVFRHPDDHDTASFEKAVLQAYQGGTEGGGYGAVGDDLGVQAALYTSTPVSAPTLLLDSFAHTLIVVLVDKNLLELYPTAFWGWLTNAWNHIDATASAGRHGLLIVPMEERQTKELIAKAPALGSLQMASVQSYGEDALRPAMLALHTVHVCRCLLATALPETAVHGQPAGFLRLFISHAKVDGLPLAQALRHQVMTIPWLKGFYDADDLPSSGNWKKDLESAVASSLIVMLRTEAYDGRTWCQNEVWWADEYATPAVVVEARTGLNFRGSVLPVDRLPVVRIPDGNLFRVLFLALREGLRYLHFMRRITLLKAQGRLPNPVELRVFSSAPSMMALLRAAHSLTAAKIASGVTPLIIYPDPVLRTGVYEAAAALVATHAPAGTLLRTPETLASVPKP